MNNKPVLIEVPESLFRVLYTLTNGIFNFVQVQRDDLSLTNPDDTLVNGIQVQTGLETLIIVCKPKEKD